VCRFGLNLDLPTHVICGTKCEAQLLPSEAQLLPFEAQLLPFEFWKSHVLNLDPETNYPRGFHYFPQLLGENSKVVFQIRPEPPIQHPFQCFVR
jgi:hypothetical protein